MSEYLTKRTALIDADYVIYEAAAWAHSSQADLLDLTERVMTTLGEWQRKAFAEESVLLLSCSRDDGFRKECYAGYKSNRTAEAPAMLDAVRKIVIESEYRAVSLPTLEADDLMGILATNEKVPGPVIVSRDKDMRQIPGWHLNPYKEDFPVFVTEEAADLLFYQQWLTGDSTDGYGGIKGCGPKKAEKLLPNVAGLESSERRVILEQACLRAYQQAEVSLDDALAQARCARILRNEDFDATTKTPILWTPSLTCEVEGYWEAGKVGQNG